MNYFIEGLQGSGKSTAVQKLTELDASLTPVREGDYSPVELAWCAYTDDAQYRGILDRFPTLSDEIRYNTFDEGDRHIICYTKVHTDDHDFYKQLEQYEIYNGRTGYDKFRDIVLTRYKNWHSNGNIFECSLLQNTVTDMLLFRQASDDEIMAFYKDVRDVLEGKDYRIIYLETEDIPGNLSAIRKERCDENGNEVWFDMMCGYFDHCPYAVSNGLTGFEGIVSHLEQRQRLELRICSEIFHGHTTILHSKKYDSNDLI